MVEGLSEFIDRFKIKTRVVNGTKYLIMYKAVRSDFGSIWLDMVSKRDKGAYRLGMTVVCRKWSSNRRNECGKGLHVATRNFADGFAIHGDKVIEVLVHPKDVICVPPNTNGKIRCRRLVVARVLRPRFYASAMHGMEAFDWSTCLMCVF